MTELISFNGWDHCIRLYNDQIDTIISTDIGPRILRFGFIGQQNFFFLRPEEAGLSGGDSWRIYGGHRFWHAPEAMPRTYAPDNGPVRYTMDEYSVRVTQPAETTTGLIKEMDIQLTKDSARVKVIHRLINPTAQTSTLAPWGISVLAPGGRAVIPQEPFGHEDDFLLPARPLVFWQYAQMNDPRWQWGNQFIVATQDPEIRNAQKIGVLNRQGWAAYSLNDQLFIKQFGFDSDAVYPDFNCNNELYFNEHLLEIESLAPIREIRPGESVEHVETWKAVELDLGNTEEEIAKQIYPYL